MMTWFVTALIIVILLFIIQTITILAMEYRKPSKAIAWLFILLIFPIIGFIMYAFVAREYRTRRRLRRKWTGVVRSDTSSVEGSSMGNYAVGKCRRLLSVLEQIPQAPITFGNEIEVLTNAEATYKVMLAEMNQAQHHIHMESYIIRSDHIGCIFKDVFIRKAHEGVIVRIIYDGVGSYGLDANYMKELQDAGVQVYAFLPVRSAFLNKRFNYRNHRKILVVDGRVGFQGGINIGDEYLGADIKLGFWRDSHLRIGGKAVATLQASFLTDWRFVSGKSVRADAYYPASIGEGSSAVQVFTSGPDQQADHMLEFFFSAICEAEKRVYVTTPYFIPDSSLMMALHSAAVSGVDVRIIIPGIADSRIVLSASLSYMEELLRVGVRFYRYQKGFMHAKVLIVDDKIGSLGTANLDMRSLFSNFEVNAVLFDRHAIARLLIDFRRDLADSFEVQLAEFEQRSRWQRAGEVTARLLSPLL